jgi:hypothetical protein
MADHVACVITGGQGALGLASLSGLSSAGMLLAAQSNCCDSAGTRYVMHALHISSSVCSSAVACPSMTNLAH